MKFLNNSSTHRTVVNSAACISIAITLTVSSLHSIPASANESQSQTTKNIKNGKVEISRFTVEGAGSVNTYWIDTSQGLIVVDFQRDTESAEKALAQIKATSKPVIAMLLTHAHPDHIGGLEQFKRAFPDAPLYATQSTADELKNDTKGYQKMTLQMLQDKAPIAYPLADRILKDKDRVEISGLAINVTELGKGESESATVFYLPQIGALFSGDVVANQMTDFLLEQHTGKWLAQIDRLSKLHPGVKSLYPGHGAPGNPAKLIKEQRAGLTFIRAQVKQQIAKGHWDGKALSKEGASAVISAVQARYPGYLPVAPIPGLNELNVNAVAQELNRKND
jgi:glyoxylase-like metal-dependent hydrolase (beta-lactamase superfamily II)